MIRVRFPNGQCVTYNDAYHVNRRAIFTDIYDSSKEERWFAQVPTAMCVVERVAPCSVENPLEGDLLERAAALLEQMEEARERTDWRTDNKLRRIKTALRSFNLTTRSWR